MNEKPLSDLRKKRFLLLAYHRRSMKQWYHLIYYPLIQEGYISWVMGTAFITDKGLGELNRLSTLFEIIKR